MCCVWSHCFSRCWKKCSPQWRWLVVDMYLAVLRGSVNIHYQPPPLWWIVVDCTHELESLKVINKYYLPFSGRRGKNCISVLQFLIIFRYIAKKIKVHFWCLCGINYTKTGCSPCIHLSVTESGGHVHQLQWIIKCYLTCTLQLIQVIYFTHRLLIVGHKWLLFCSSFSCSSLNENI